jgi:hypothetical protein
MRSYAVGDVGSVDALDEREVAVACVDVVCIDVVGVEAGVEAGVGAADIDVLVVVVRSTRGI